MFLKPKAWWGDINDPVCPGCNKLRIDCHCEQDWDEFLEREMNKLNNPSE